MSLPDRPSQETIDCYINSNLFWTKKWKDSCEIWYTLQKNMQGLNIKSVLNVGVGYNAECRLWNSFFVHIFNSKEFTNIDIVQDHINTAKKYNDSLVANSLLCDIREVDNVWQPNSFDLIFWSHGPEHIYRHEWKDTFEKIEEVASKLVILQCPWGSGYDRHPGHFAKSIQKNELEEFGYSVLTCGIKDTRDAGILAWKIL